jgi:GSH-dependent disulfide-bond oxidoreductase
MIDFYAWKTPNNDKVAILLEELELPYQLFPIDLMKQKQFSAEFLKINPNNKVPAIVDSDGYDHRPMTLSESGAILLYLAEKTQKFIPTNSEQRIKMMQWLMFQMSGVGPMLGQLHYFLYYAAERIPYAIERYTNEGRRLYRVMDEHLERQTYFVDEYSIADIAIFPWVNLHERQRIELDEYPNLKRWHRLISARPAVLRGLQALHALVEKN